MEVADVRDREKNGERFFEVTVFNIEKGAEETYFAYNLILGNKKNVFHRFVPREEEVVL